MTRCRGAALPRWVAWGLAVGVFVMAGAASSAPRTAHRIDHVGLGIGDLDRGIAQVTELTGVKPARGGAHPGGGTHNALLSLGEGTYLEILAPVPGAKVSQEVAELAEITGKATPI